ncbi:9919_t:CDS:2 [Diversispora eburnea]|uniref:9919_t:CDS:1 n=1 Tax=Diversispora eburnea TaxID=1213867 RepID=A0A9N8W2C5_9GLOM|nr:9919_t:CDS:2 [Diversispora eburnea]
MNLYFSRDYEKDQYKLIEIPIEVADMIENMQIQEGTFTMRKQKYSDSLFLLAPLSITNIRKPENEDNANNDENNEDNMDVDNVDVDNNNNNDSISRNFEVIDVLNHICELTPSAPKIEQLDDLLNKTSYKGQDEEINYFKDKAKFYTFDELEEIIQASEEELRNSLKKRSAIEIEGYWRYIDQEYINEVFKACIIMLDPYNMEIDQVTAKEYYEIIECYGFPNFIVKHTLALISETIDTNESEPIFSLSKEKIARYVGIQILRQTEKFDNAIILENKENNLSVISNEQDKIIKYYPISRLSSDPKLRFEQLFHSRPFWRDDYIKPFLVDFCLDLNDKFSLRKYNELILKYAIILYIDGRIYRENGHIFYISKWANKLI